MSERDKGIIIGACAMLGGVIFGLVLGKIIIAIL